MVFSLGGVNGRLCGGCALLGGQPIEEGRLESAHHINIAHHELVECVEFRGVTKITQSPEFSVQCGDLPHLFVELPLAVGFTLSLNRFFGLLNNGAIVDCII